MARSPRTLVLMVLALLSSGWFWWRMNARQAPPASGPRLQLITLEDGGLP